MNIIKNEGNTNIIIQDLIGLNKVIGASNNNKWSVCDYVGKDKKTSFFADCQQKNAHSFTFPLNHSLLKEDLQTNNLLFLAIPPK